jgi:hypothetical protein
MTDLPDNPAQPSDDLVSRLGRVRPMTHQEDERPNREQIEAAGRHPVHPGPPVPLPRWLWGGKKKPKRRA